MKHPEWSDNLSVGLPAIDEQHKQLFAIFDDLRIAIEQEHGEKVLQETFQRLDEYTSTHFSDEEAYMRDIGYPGLKDHMIEHGQLLLRFQMLWNRKKKKQPVRADGVVYFLQEWIIEHITSTDRKIGDFAHSKN